MKRIGLNYFSRCRLPRRVHRRFLPVRNAGRPISAGWSSPVRSTRSMPINVRRAVIAGRTRRRPRRP